MGAGFGGGLTLVNKCRVLLSMTTLFGCRLVLEVVVIVYVNGVTCL